MGGYLRISFWGELPDEHGIGKYCNDEECNDKVECTKERESINRKFRIRHLTFSGDAAAGPGASRGDLGGDPVEAAAPSASACIAAPARRGAFEFALRACGPIILAMAACEPPSCARPRVLALSLSSLDAFSFPICDIQISAGTTCAKTSAWICD